MERLCDLTLVLVLVLVLGSGSGSGLGSPAAQQFCHGMPCPEYTVVQKYEGYEERSYVETRWISSKVLKDSTTDLMEGYARLKNYCNGDNTAGAKVSKDTWPALISVLEAADGTPQELTVSWFSAPGTSLPPPTDKLVYIETRPPSKVYVRSFGGIASRKDGLTNAKELRACLDQAGKPYVAHNYTGAGYDSPFDLIHPHHNEVWIYAPST